MPQSTDQRRQSARRQGAGWRRAMATTAPGAPTIPATSTPALPPPPPAASVSRAEAVLLPAALPPPLPVPAPPPRPRAPEDLQVCVRTTRAERVTTSCSECRRRKQKCDQGRPCSNCVKRFPRPPCEYKQNRHPGPAHSHEPAFKVLLPGQDHDYAGFSGIQGLVRSPALDLQQQHQLLSAQSLLLPAPLPHPLPPPQQQWDVFAATTATDSTANSIAFGMPGHAAHDRWPGLDLMSLDAYGVDLMTDAPENAAIDGSDDSSLATTPLQLGVGHVSNAAASSPWVGAVPALGGSNLPVLVSAQSSAMLHHEVLQDAVRLLHAHRMLPTSLLVGCNAKRTVGFYAWLRMVAWTAPGRYGTGDGTGDVPDYDDPRARAVGISSAGIHVSSKALHVARILPGTTRFHIASPAAAVSAQQPQEAMQRSVDPIAIYTKLISQFKSCLEGNTDPLSPYPRVFVPYCLQTPLLAQVAVYTSACFLHETGHLDKMLDVAHKGRAVQMLNSQQQQQQQQLSGSPGTSITPPPSSDDAITAVIQLIMDEWYRGQPESLHGHLQSLQEMIRLRGGLRNLGMNGLMSKLVAAVVHLTAIHGSDMDDALPLERGRDPGNSSSSAGSALFDYQEPAQAPFRVAHNTPLVDKLPSFAQCADHLKMHPTTASILDDVRFLVAAVLALPPNPSAKDLKKVQTTAEWIQARVQRLPADSPHAQSDDPRRDGALPTNAVASAGPVTFCPLSVTLSQAEPLRQPRLSSPLARRGDPPEPASLPSSQQYHRWASASPRLPDSSRPSCGRGSRREPAREDPWPQTGTAPPAPAASVLQVAFSKPVDQPQEQPSVGQPTAPTAHADPLYQAVRQTALIYARAVLQRKPISEVVDHDQFLRLWTTTWRVSLTAWKGLLGVFTWVTLAIVASARDTPHDLFVKSMLSVCVVQMSLESWSLTGSGLKAALRLNTWLAGGEPLGGKATADGRRAA